jgi:hypothetical protein
MIWSVSILAIGIGAARPSRRVKARISLLRRRWR